MGNVFTLDSLREEVEKEFAPVKISLPDGTKVTLRSLVRLNKKDREAVLSALDDLDDARSQDYESEEGKAADGVDKLAAAAAKVLTLVSDNGKALVRALNGDLALTMKVLESWMEATQVGEAENSPVSSTDTASSS